MIGFWWSSKNCFITVVARQFGRERQLIGLVAGENIAEDILTRDQK